MNPNSVSVRKAAQLWLEGRCESFSFRKKCSDGAERLWRISKAISSLLRTNVPTASALQRVGELFDDVAEHSFAQDVLGERFEVGATLAFIGWRNAYLLERESDSYEWIRICDLLVNEPAADFERLEAYLYLPSEKKSQELSQSFLRTSLDLFVSLAILRRDRFRRPLAVIAAAGDIYHSVISRAAVSREFPFFAGEAALLAASISRLLGRRAESGSWLTCAKGELGRMACRRGFRVRLHLVAATKHLNEHRHRHLLPRLIAIRKELHNLGLHHDETVCRMAIAEVTKIIGDTSSALAQYSEIVAETRYSSMTAVLGISLSNLATYQAESGEQEKASAAQAEALEVIDPADPVTLASVIIAIGSTRVLLGDPVEGVRLFDVAAQIYERVGARLWHAFARIMEAETLSEIGHFASALKALAIAIPIINSEKMAVEGIHASKILSRIASNSSECRELVLELMAQVSHE